MMQEELISKFQSLKQIKPREEWVFLAKMQILGQSNLGQSNLKVESAKANKVNYIGVLSNIFSLAFQRKFAYSLALFLLAVFGVAGFMKYALPGNDNNDRLEVAQQPTAALIAIKSDVEDFKAKSKNLAEVSKNKSQQDVSLAIKEVKDSAKSLTNSIQKNPQLAKSVALDINNNKTYLDIAGEDNLEETADLYKAVVYLLVEDLNNNKTNLTEDQKKTLDKIENLRDQGRYVYALESALLLGSSIESK